MPRLTALISAFLIALGGASPASAQDATAGKTVFKKCVACHQVGETAKNRSGPVLNDLIGRSAGTFEGFRYSKDLVAAGDQGLVWTEILVAQYIADPKLFLRNYLDDGSAKSRMSFRLKGAKQRLDVAAYLAAAPVAAPGPGQTVEETKPVPGETRSIDQVIADQVFDTGFLEDPTVVAAGKALWDGQCALCHGAKAYPGKAPKLKPRKYKPAFVFKRTYKGFKAMPGWNEIFSIDEIRSIVAYVKSPGFSP